MVINVICEFSLLLIMVDFEKLGCFFFNLVVNVLKYGYGVSYIYLMVKQLGEKVVIMVVDDGEKIFVELVKYFFECFYWVELLCNKVIGGIGLGLVIV